MFHNPITKTNNKIAILDKGKLVNLLNTVKDLSFLFWDELRETRRLKLEIEKFKIEQMENMKEMKDMIKRGKNNDK